MIADGMLRPGRTVEDQDLDTTAAVATVTRPQVPARTATQRDRIFYTTVPVLMALAVLYGFARSYYFKLAFGTPSLSPLYHLHGVLFTSWLALLMVQTSLVAAGRTAHHRRWASPAACWPLR